MSKTRIVSSGSWSGPTVQARKVISGSWNPSATYSGVRLVGENGGGTWDSGATGYNIAQVAGATIGDVCIITSVNRFNTPLTLPAGFTRIQSVSVGGSAIIDVIYKILNGTEVWPITLHNSLNNGYGWLVQQTVLRGASSTAPTVAWANAGYTSHVLSTGAIRPQRSLAYVLHYVASNTNATPTAIDMKVLRSHSQNAYQSVCGRRLLNSGSTAFHVTYDAILQNVAMITLIIEPI